MEQKSSDFPIFIGQAGPLNGQRWSIEREIIIGRENDCDIIIPDRQVSRYHARITPTNNGVVLEDLASKNGTYRNGEKTDLPVILQDGDHIQIALVQSFSYLSSDATVPLGSGTPETELLHDANKQVVRKLFLDKLSRRVWIGDQEVLPPLSVPQFRLLEALSNQPDRVVSRQELISTVWGDDEALGVSDQALDALVRRLRDRLALLDPNHAYLITVRGYGLRLDNPEE